MPRFFVIRSRLCNKVLDIEAGNTNPGANVIIYDYNGGQNQLFYEDRSGVIRAKINNFAIDDSGEVNELFWNEKKKRLHLFDSLFIVM